MTSRTRPRRLTAATGVLTVLTVLAALAPAALAAGHTVDITGFSYSPRELTVAVGDTVTWSNSDAQSHTATADDGGWDSGRIGNNESRSVTLTAAGTFGYHCTIHPEMTAMLTVTGAMGTAPPTDVAVVPGRPGGGGSAEALTFVLALAAFAGVAAARRRSARS